MIVEWECVLACNYKCFYCGNGRNDMIDKPIPFETDIDKVFKFLDGIKSEFPDEELFVFGGEPFLHPHIELIIKHMNEIGLKFVIQTNFSCTDRIRMIADTQELNIQISLHPSEINDKIDTLNGIEEMENIIRRIDVMFIGQPSYDLFREVIQRLNDKSILYTTPVADFNISGVCNDHLYEFNKVKKTVFGQAYRFEKGDRSYQWEDQMRGDITYKGKTCIYKDKYVLFDPALKRYTCNYRQNNEVCPNDQCFLM